MEAVKDRPEGKAVKGSKTVAQPPQYARPGHDPASLGHRDGIGAEQRHVMELPRDGRPSENGRNRRPKAGKACVNCRKQKMKCVDNQDPRGCRRCVRSGVPCIFVPRANAATLPSGLLALAAGRPSVDRPFKDDVLRRLQALEEYLGFSTANGRRQSGGSDDELDDNDEDGQATGGTGSDDEGEVPAAYASLGALWEATSVLCESAPTSVPRRIWKKATVGELWSAFHERMPGLHFMPRKQTFSVPQPLLVASILYCSSIRGPPDMAADLAPHYFTVLCNAIAQLSVPESSMGRPYPRGGSSTATTDAYEEWAFQTVLGIVLAGLLAEASVTVTGLWISVAYRLILEHCPADQALLAANNDGGGGAREWRKLFSGVQIVDLEHASLHLSCPVIPIECPLPALSVGVRDQLYRLSRMMHTGLTHFTGRGLPTIWSVFTGNSSNGNGSGNGIISTATPAFTAVDAAVIRDWAHQLDGWLVEFSSMSDDSASTALDRQVVFRQYVLHRLVVLSIYHPARGCDLWSNGITPQEQRELLLSARATLKLHLHDDSIWSNWDLVMITWAALIVVQGVEGGVGEADDLRNIRVHLEMLNQMNVPKSKLCDRLIGRLEESLRGVNTPDMTVLAMQPQPQPSFLGPDDTTTGPSPGSMDYSAWQIFDQASLQQISFRAEWAGRP
ncbi:hypothetical protein CMQ_1812 [Grosmannia clavigera kw1407]|uniref:Zn(2)-C6 fungal-type domain-containing protein n=1 Tax=Grosmannia clavigera (strain kw1407 / UAMH 11150) TaxID=655863 RepID=F0XAX3_GROCL|nr:uncharacterized protein CMQ_1812 [Grosmannia clavigera kw1407]EFX05176.1 hypothetical protein CMQ_1812 [Grosmannia clavigera kw1407]